ncbi:hypothetical protein D3C81_1694270 [compost metagenome]
MPVPGGDQPGRDQTADGRAKGEAAEHDRHQGRTQASRAILAGQGDDVGHGGAQADAGDEAVDQQLVHRSGEGRQQGEQAEDEGRDQDDGLAAELVRRRAQGEGADRQAQKADGEDRSERRRGQAPVLGDLGRDEGDRLGVEAVEHGDDEAQRRDAEL